MVAALSLLSFLDRIEEYVSDSPITYGVVAGASALDGFFPLAPSETVVIAAGTLAGSGELALWLLLPAAALGAFVGDNISYALGATLGERAVEKFMSGEKGRRRLKAAQRLLDRHGGLIIVAARFIPGGRTATTFAAGTLDLTWRRFAAYDAVAVAIWSTYSVMVGYLGGAAFQEDTWKALALGFGIALVFAGVVEVVRRIQARRGNDLLT